MPTTGGHKTVRTRILHYAQEIGWVYISRHEAEARRGFDRDGATPEGRAREFGDSLSLELPQAVAEMEITS